MASIVYHPNSSNIAKVSWDDADGSNSLVVNFVGGTWYRSRGHIPKSIILEWIAAESAGKFYHDRIKGVYEMEKVQDGTDGS